MLGLPRSFLMNVSAPDNRSTRCLQSDRQGKRQTRGICRRADAATFPGRCSTAPSISSSTGSGSALSGRGQRAIAIMEEFAAEMGPADGARRNADVADDDLAAVCRAGQCRRLAHLGAGRCPQRLGLPPAAVVFPPALAMAQQRRRIGPRLHHGVGRRLRGRHPHRRVSRPLALPACSTPPARPAPSPLPSQPARLLGLDAGDAATQSARPARRPPGSWEFLRDAANSKQLHTGQGRRRRADRRLPGARRLHRRQAHPRRRARHGGRHVVRRRSGRAHRPSGHALGAARDVVQVPRLVPPHPSGRRRAAPGDRGDTICRPPTSPRSPPMSTRGRSTCSAP